jgi:hypothetical protein
MENLNISQNPVNKALDECNRLFTHFDERAHRYKRQYETFTYLTLGLTGAVTVISALQALYKAQDWWIWVLPVVSGAATFCASMVHATNSHQLWLRARAMTHRLATERFLFTQDTGPYAEGDEGTRARRFSERLMEIWKDGHDAWEKAIEGQKGV